MEHFKTIPSSTIPLSLFNQHTMKVTFDSIRILHLILLIALTIAFGQILIQRWEWTPLAAYGLTCSIVCQINNVFLKFKDISDSLSDVDQNKNTRKKTKIRKE